MITVTTMMTFFHELDIIEAANVVVEVGISLRKLQQIQMNSNLHQMQITLSMHLFKLFLLGKYSSFSKCVWNL